MFYHILKFVQFFTMPKVFYCFKCTFQYLRPVGKKCQYKGESLASDVVDAAPPSVDPDSVATVSDKILLQLQQLGDECLVKDISRQVLPILPVLFVQNLESHGIDTEDTVESVVPSLGYFRNNTSIQAEVNKRLSQLAKNNETATRGRMKSQRGGPREIPVKKVLDWPQNFILTGSRKS